MIQATEALSEARVAATAARRTLRGSLRSLTGNRRLRSCGAGVVDAVAGVDLVRSAEGGAHFSGLQTCGSIWLCPVCAARIREARAAEIESALATHFDRDGGSAAFLTLTMPHDYGDHLGPLMETIGEGFTALVSGRAIETDRDDFGIVGHIRATEVTHGESGWHPHLHVLLLFDGPLPEGALAELRLRLWGRWRNYVTGRGYRAPSFSAGCTLSEVRSRDEVASYVAKVDAGYSVARELTRHDAKIARRAGRTPFAIATTADTDAHDRALWLEYETATHRRHAIQWSRGLRARLAVVELSDDELAAVDTPGEVFAHLETATWRAVLRARADGHLLDACAAGDRATVDRLLADFRYEAVRWAAKLQRLRT